MGLNISISIDHEDKVYSPEYISPIHEMEEMIDEVYLKESLRFAESEAEKEQIWRQAKGINQEKQFIMKNLIILALLFLVNYSFGQTAIHKEKFRQLEPDLWMDLWDKANSDTSIDIDSLSYDKIPKYLDFRGTLVEALKWTDKAGENILLLSITGHFTWIDPKDDPNDFVLQDKSELYAYLFQRNESAGNFTKKWRIYDFVECFGVDWKMEFISKATTITDLDQDGIAEISIPYRYACRGDVSPGTMKIILYEGSTKFALRGSTKVMCNSDHPYGGEFKPSENLNSTKVFKDFLIERWKAHMCEF